MFNIEEIIQITQATPLCTYHSKENIEHLLTDSRQGIFNANALFIALVGERHNGHHFIPDLIKKGIRNFLISQPLALSSELPKTLNVLQVPHTLRALQAIAKAHREKFSYPVVAITGSNGKTIVKEWLAELLGEHFHIVKSPKSYNSQVGVPLSIWQMNHQHKFAIFEAGISKPQEMAFLQEMIQPTLGIFTNIGEAHDEGFKNRTQKIEEKYLLFKDTPLVFSANKELLATKLPKLQCNFEIIAQDYSFKTSDVNLHFSYQNQVYDLNIPFQDKASVENVLSCLCVLLHCGIPSSTIQHKIRQLKPIAMRLEAKPALNHCLLIDDSYNNDWAGLKIALDFLKNQPKKSKSNLIILSDIFESGETSHTLYTHVAQLLQNYAPFELIGIGDELVKHKALFPADSLFFASTEEFLQSKIYKNFQNANILLKGARKFAFEKIAKTLTTQQHKTTFEINLDAIVHNLNFHRSLLKPTTKIMVMVKAFAYGNGIKEIATLLQHQLIDYLAVAYTDEGVELRKNHIFLPIMVLNVHEEDFENLIENDLEPIIYSNTLWEKWLNFLQIHQVESKIYKFHLEIDTGMRRLGFDSSQLLWLYRAIQKLPDFAQIASVFSHLSSADEPQFDEFTKKQITHFQDITAKIATLLPYPFLRHLANSAGITRFPEAHFDMVRLGVSLYGIATHPTLKPHLAVVGTLKTIISQIKELPQGEHIGYGQKGKLLQKGKIGIIAIGYADGFSRKLSNGIGKVWVNGKIAPVIGNVCMDMTMIDLTNIEAQEGDEVIIFGKELPIEQLASVLETIPYEILTSINTRVKRVFYVT